MTPGISPPPPPPRDRGGRGGSSRGKGSKVKRGRALISGEKAHGGPSPWGDKKPRSLAEKAVGVGSSESVGVGSGETPR